MWIQTSIWSNTFKTFLLIALFPILLFWIILIVFSIIFYNEAWIWQSAIDKSFIQTIEIFIILWPIIFIWLIISFWFHKQIIFNFSWAVPITRKEYPEIYNIVENLCISKGLPTPNIWILEDDSLNAFATWWELKKSWIVFSRWLLKKLNKQEIEAVAAHELTHIINKDSMLMIVIIVFIWAIATIWEILFRIAMRSSSWSSNKKNWQITLIMLIVWLCFLILWYLAFPLIQLAISRKREFLADAWSVELTKDKYALISALQKISQDPVIESIKKETVAAICIESPFNKEKWFWHFISNLLSTHPSIENRIKALENY